MKIRESHLQNGIFIYKMEISFTKQDFKLQKENLGIQMGFSLYNLPLLLGYMRVICTISKKVPRTQKYYRSI